MPCFSRLVECSFGFIIKTNENGTEACSQDHKNKIYQREPKFKDLKLINTIKHVINIENGPETLRRIKT